MEIQQLTLSAFRNLPHKKFDFSKKIVVIVGPNASGKTNILEAINLLSSGKSFRAGREEEMIKNGDELTRVQGQARNNEPIKLEVVVTRGQLDGKKVGRKKFLVNGVAKRLYNFTGSLKTVLFGPWDMVLVTESPSVRRKFLDIVLSQVDREYRRSLLSYEKGVRQRNKLLERIRDGQAGRSQLLFWNNLLIKNGNYITAKRAEFIDFVNMTPDLEWEVSIDYDQSIISEGRVEKYAEEEVAAATTLVGPHRDNFVFKATKGRNLATYGSRGEQRMAVLWLKLAELLFIEGKTGQRPVLLLDDIFSELDHEHREIVMNVIDKQQTILTTADPHTIEEWRKSAQVVEL